VQGGLRSALVNVLWIDSEPSVRHFGRKLLSGFSGLEFFESGSKDEALDVLSRNQIDLVLVEIALSRDTRNRDGQILIKHIHDNTSAIPVVVSSVSEVVEITTAMRNGAYDYILKESFSNEILESLVERIQSGMALRKHRQQKIASTDPSEDG